MLGQDKETSRHQFAFLVTLPRGSRRHSCKRSLLGGKSSIPGLVTIVLNLFPGGWHHEEVLVLRHLKVPKLSCAGCLDVSILCGIETAFRWIWSGEYEKNVSLEYVRQKKWIHKFWAAVGCKIQSPFRLSLSAKTGYSPAIGWQGFTSSSRLPVRLSVVVFRGLIKQAEGYRNF